MTSDKNPILFLDVNLGADDFSRIVIFDGDDPISVADKFCEDNGKCVMITIIDLDEKKKSKLIAII